MPTNIADPVPGVAPSGRHLPGPLRAILLLALLWVFLFAISLMGTAFKTFGKALCTPLCMALCNTIVAMGAMNRRQEFRRSFAGATMHDFFNLLTIIILFPLEQATHFLQHSATWLAAKLAGSGGAEYHSPVKAVVKPAANRRTFLRSQCRYLVFDRPSLCCVVKYGDSAIHRSRLVS